MFTGTFATKLFFNKFELQTVKAGNGRLLRGMVFELNVANVDVVHLVKIMLINEPDKTSDNINAKRKKILWHGKKNYRKFLDERSKIDR